MPARIRSALRIQDDSPPKILSIPRIARSLTLLALAALADRASLLNLSPIYGSIPASAYHNVPSILAVLLSGCSAVSGIIPSEQVLTLALPMHAAIIPALMHYILAPASSTLGPTGGPLITELVTLLPLLTLTFSLVHLINADLPTRDIKAGDGLLVLGSSLLYIACVRLLDAWLVPNIGTSPWLSRWTLELAVASAYVLLYPSRLLFVSLVPALSFLLQTSPHGSLPGNVRRLNRNLRLENYKLLERRESVTGYLSVLQSEQNQFRVLRCDHSLLGGIWLPTEERRNEGISTAEPVFPVFTMLEAVRLMQSTTDDASHDHPKKALVIGLGIGTCPSALAAHGINTTTLELDPGVTALARAHFGFDAAQRVIHGDAAATAARLAAAGESFDYIVHDVFTGGAEPVPLFTLAFLRVLASVLAPGGSIALNYVGDLMQPTTALVLDTIMTAFPNCRVYRDEARKDGAAHDVANFVAFCRAGAWRFREPGAADFLGSRARRAWLLPTRPVDLSALPRLENEPVLEGEMVRVLEGTQARSAAEHWRAMRGLLPHAIWLNW